MPRLVRHVTQSIEQERFELHEGMAPQGQVCSGMAAPLAAWVVCLAWGIQDEAAAASSAHHPSTQMP